LIYSHYYGAMAIRVGLTGGAGSGKSTIDQMFRGLGVLTLDSDQVVHGILKNDGGVIELIKERYPSVVLGGVVDRQKLAHCVFPNILSLRWLEALVHPRVFERIDLFISHRQPKPLIVLEVPLLFETGYETKCDCVIVALCRERVRKKRLLQAAPA
jgi:dephospho-CoA kinase